jgi:hypothetical protein
MFFPTFSTSEYLSGPSTYQIMRSTYQISIRRRSDATWSDLKYRAHQTQAAFVSEIINYNLCEAEAFFMNFRLPNDTELCPRLYEGVTKSISFSTYLDYQTTPSSVSVFAMKSSSCIRQLRNRYLVAQNKRNDSKVTSKIAFMIQKYIVNHI